MKKIQPKSTSFDPNEIVEEVAKKARASKAAVRRALAKILGARKKKVASASRTKRTSAARRGGSQTRRGARSAARGRKRTRAER